MDGYSARRTVTETGSTFALEGGVLVRTTEKGETQRLALADVRKVALRYVPATSDRWVCSVEGPAGRIWIPSVSFLGFGRAVDRRASFRAFVAQLCQAIAAEPSAASKAFVLGGGFPAWAALIMVIVFVVLVALLAMGVLGSVTEGKSPTWAILPIIVCSTSCAMVWRIWRMNPSGRFDPRALPPKFAA
ncbi:MAG TPA: hypothetical protein VHW60_03985 [Caulobacteraceae bacterium]|jgi:hypothetical protein|nr:hypothetical protein [Caulobacteraceae bacterium]